MYKKILFAILVLVSLRGLAQTKKAVFVIVDGVSSDVIENLDLPGIKAIVSDGAYLRAHQGGDRGTYNETPTISAPGYNNVLTGTWANKHNVINNKIADPNYNYPTIFRLFKNQYPDKKIAVFSAWLDNRTRLMGHNLPQTGNLPIDYAFDGYELDTVRFKHDKSGDFFGLIDAQIAADASKTIKEKAPDLSWVYLEEPDAKGHRFGDGPEYQASIRHIDQDLALIYDAIKYRQQQFKEDWLLIITTDHGRAEEDGKKHGLQTDRMRNTWLATNKKDLNAYANTYDASVVDILPTIARFMNVKPAAAIQYELDGTPLMGPVSVAELHSYYVQGKLVVTWKALEPSGKVKIRVTPTNNVKTGGKDDYVMLGEFPVNRKYATVDVSKYPSSFYKVVLEGTNNTLNTWVNVPPPEAAAPASH